MQIGRMTVGPCYKKIVGLILQVGAVLALATAVQGGTMASSGHRAWLENGSAGGYVVVVQSPDGIRRSGEIPETYPVNLNLSLDPAHATTPVVMHDLDGDGQPEFLIGFEETEGEGGRLFPFRLGPGKALTPIICVAVISKKATSGRTHSSQSIRWDVTSSTPVCLPEIGVIRVIGKSSSSRGATLAYYDFQFDVGTGTLVQRAEGIQIGAALGGVGAAGLVRD